MSKYDVLVNMCIYAELYLEQRIKETNEETKMEYIHELEDIKELYRELAVKELEGAL